MADKRQWYPKYWAEEQPIPKEKMVVRFDHVQHRAGIQGGKIGNLGPGAHVIVDLNEDSGGDVRIISVVDYVPQPIPLSWEQKQIDWGITNPAEREWWVDKSSLVDAGEPQPGGIKLLVERDEIGNWSITEL